VPDDNIENRFPPSTSSSARAVYRSRQRRRRLREITAQHSATGHAYKRTKWEDPLTRRRCLDDCQSGRSNLSGQAGKPSTGSSHTISTF